MLSEPCVYNDGCDPLYVHVTHTQHTHTHTHKHIHTHTHTHTPHYNMFEHKTLMQLILSQHWAGKSELLGWISSSDLDSQPCVVWLCLLLLCSSVYVRMCVSVCSVALFSFALLAGPRFFWLPNRPWVAPSPFLSLGLPWVLVLKTQEYLEC